MKFAASGAILFFLWRQADEPLAQLADRQKHWGLLASAYLAGLAGTIVSFLRWRLLVQMLGLRFSLQDSLRLGFLGYLFNFVSLGAVGGDLFKAVVVAREHPGRRAQAVATVIVDRIVGLYALMLLAAVALAVNGTLGHADAIVRTASQFVVAGAAVATAVLGLAMLPAFTGPTMSAYVERLPRVGRHAAKLLGAVALYRRNLPGLAVALGMSFCVHLLLTLCVYLAGRGMFERGPTWGSHLAACPLAFLTGVLPLPVSGLGAFETVLELLYRVFGQEAGVVAGEGLLVAFAYRAITIGIAVVGGGYYLASRKEVASVLNEAGSTA